YVAACPAAFAFLLFNSDSLDFSSIHWSSFDFLNRQRFPSLKAGIFCSPTYLYSVSALTPRYCEAWRIFITSRESAIVSKPFPQTQAPLPPFFRGTQGKLGRKFLVPV